MSARNQKRLKVIVKDGLTECWAVQTIIQPGGMTMIETEISAWHDNPRVAVKKLREKLEVCCAECERVGGITVMVPLGIDMEFHNLAGS